MLRIRLVPAFALIIIPFLLITCVYADSGGISTSINGFGLKLFKGLAEAQKDSNVIISPLSVSMALAMVYNGAEGKTKEAMAKTLELDGASLDQIDDSFKTLRESLKWELKSWTT